MLVTKSPNLNRVIERIESLKVCKECGKTISAKEIGEGAGRLIDTGLNSDMATGLMPRCGLCISELIASNIGDTVALEILITVLRIAAETGKAFVAYRDDDGERSFQAFARPCLTTTELRSQIKAKGQTLLSIERI